jgi:hypothetical protein
MYDTPYTNDRIMESTQPIQSVMDPNRIKNCNECSSLFTPEKDPEIHNIIQEILAVIDNVSFLLTLQK